MEANILTIIKTGLSVSVITVMAAGILDTACLIRNRIPGIKPETDKISKSDADFEDLSWYE